MVNRLKSLWINLIQNLFFVPLAVVGLFVVFGIGLVELDKDIELTGSGLVFNGDTGAARTVLSVIAGSLITVAGLTFSITIVVLQLASSQFSPRILRTFFGDRLTQITIGTFVGVFVYAILVLRAVGSPEDVADFVPRVAVTVGSVLSIVAVILLIWFLHHVSQLVQASHVAGHIALETLSRADKLYPDTGEPVRVPPEAPLAAWRVQTPARVMSQRPGFVQRVAAEGLDRLGDKSIERLAFLVRPGDFVSTGVPIVEVWPREAGEEALEQVQALVTVSDERDMHQDLDFGLRQLADMAVKALSPGINDPTTAITCLGYIRSILVTLASRPDPHELRRLPDESIEIYTPNRGFGERLSFMREIGRYAGTDARVAVTALGALEAVASAARAAEAPERAAAARDVAVSIATRARGEVGEHDDEQQVARALAAVQQAAG